MDLESLRSGDSGKGRVQRGRSRPAAGVVFGWVRSYASVLGIVAIGMALTLLGTRLARKSQRDRAVSEFRERAATLATAFGKRLQSAAEVVDGVASFFAASQEVDRDEFRTFAEFILSHKPAVRALEYAPRIIDAARQSWEEQTSAQGFPGFQMTEKDEAGRLIRAADRDEYFPVWYVEPWPGNEAALGYDLASETTRRSALERARVTGQIAASAPIKLVQSERPKWGILVFRSAFGRKEGRTMPATAAKGQNPKGFVVCAIDPIKVVESAFQGLDREGIKATLVDRMAPGGENLLAAGAPEGAAEFWSRKIEVAGRTYELGFSPTPELLARHAGYESWIVFIAGTLFTLFAASRWKASLKHAARMECSERELTGSLAAAELAQKETALLDSVTEKINSGLQLQEILDYVYTAFEHIIPYDRMGFALVDDGVVHARWARSKFGPLKLPSDYSAALAGSSLEEVFRTGRPRLINDLEEYQSAHPDSVSTPLILAEGLLSSLTCPLVVNGKPVGFLFFSSHQRQAYREAHVDRFMRVAHQLSLIVDKGRCYEEVVQARRRLGDLLDNLLPKGIPEQLNRGNGRGAKAFAQASVLFADLVGFSSWSSRMPPTALVELLNGLFTEFDHLAQGLAVQKIGTFGDSYLAVAGVPSPSENHAESIAMLALSMRAVVRDFLGPGGDALVLRIGIHTGPVVAGIIGEQVYRYDIWGETVNFASRLESTGEPSRIQISDEMFLQLQGRFLCQERGLVDVKGFGQRRTFWLEGKTVNPAPIVESGSAELSTVGLCDRRAILPKMCESPLVSLTNAGTHRPLSVPPT